MANFSDFTIMMDIGHGSNTYPPTKGVPSMAEYEFNSAVVRYAKEIAESKGFKVILSQPFDSNEVSLPNRTNILKNTKIDLVMSYHADANSNPNVRGHWCFFWQGHEPSGRLALAWDKYADELLNETLDRNTRESISGDWSEFHMCRVPAQAGVPSILMEHAFMTNAQDLKLLKSEDFRKKCGIVSVKAASEFLGLDYWASEQPTPSESSSYKPTVIHERYKLSGETMQKLPRKAGNKINYDVKATDVRWTKLDKKKFRMEFVSEPGMKVSDIRKKYDADLAINLPYFWGGNIIGRTKSKGKLLKNVTSSPKVQTWHHFTYGPDDAKLVHSLNGLETESVQIAPTLLEPDSKGKVKECWLHYNEHQQIAHDIGIGKNGNMVRAQRMWLTLDTNGNLIIAASDGRSSWDQGFTIKDMAKFSLHPDINGLFSVSGDGGGSVTFAVKKGSLDIGCNCCASEGVLNQNKGINERVNGHAMLIYFLDEEEVPVVKPDPVVVNPVDESKYEMYTVTRGDNLWKIANDYGMTVDEIRQVNSMNDSIIFIGDKLKVLKRKVSEKPIMNDPKPKDPVSTPIIEYSDVVKGRYSTPSIYSLAEKKILNGFPDGTFKPNEPITREQYATSLNNAINYILNKVSDGYEKK